MKKENSTEKKQYNANDVIAHGYSIYDEWLESGFSSRKIESYVERAIVNMRSEKTDFADTEALSCLYALEMRIAKKYGTLLSCLLSFFSWRSELRALRRLRGAFNSFDDSLDVHSLIELRLQELGKNPKAKSDDGDDETAGGGKRSERSEKAAAAEQKAEAQPAEKKSEEIAQNEGTVEITQENTEAVSEQIPISEQKVKLGAQSIEISKGNTEKRSQSEKKEAQKEKNSETKKQEKNSTEKSSEPSKSDKKETIDYNKAVDLPPLHGNGTEKPKEEKMSFIDEIILNNFIKGDRETYWNTPEEGVIYEAEISEKTTERVTEQNQSSVRDARLNEEKIKCDDREALRFENKGSNPQGNENIAEKKDGNWSEEAIVQRYNRQAEAMRVQLEVLSKEFGIDAPVEIVGKHEPRQTRPSGKSKTK